MRRGSRVLKRLALFCADLIVVGLMSVFALLLRDNFESRPEQFTAFMPYLGATLVASAVSLTMLRLNRGVWRLSTLSDYLRILGASAVAVSAAVAFGFVSSRMENISRALPIMQLVLMVFALVGVRIAARLLLAWHRRDDNAVRAVPDFGSATENVLVLGINRLAHLYIRSAEEFGAGRLRIAGILTPHSDHQGRMVGLYKVLGSPETATDVVKKLAVHGVYVTRIVVMMRPEQLNPLQREQLLHAASHCQIVVEYFADTLGFSDRRGREQPQPRRAARMQSADLAVINEKLSVYARRKYWRFKRLVEGLVSVMALVVLSPLLLLISVLVAFDVGAPVIFWQQRPGARGVPFRVYKFRTMAASHDVAGRRRSDTERLSRLGAFLRLARLDELPQLFNVLLGEMSFVGPRPLLPRDQVPGLEARLTIAPGITGWAQVNGGRGVSAAEKAALDIWYLRHATPLVDLRIYGATLLMLLRGERRNEAAIEVACRELAALWPAAEPGGEVAQPAHASKILSIRSSGLPGEGSQALA